MRCTRFASSSTFPRLPGTPLLRREEGAADAKIRVRAAMAAQQPLHVRRRASACDTHVCFRQVQWDGTPTGHNKQAITCREVSMWIRMHQDHGHGSTKEDAHVERTVGCGGRGKTFIVRIKCTSADAQCEKGRRSETTLERCADHKTQRGRLIRTHWMDSCTCFSLGWNEQLAKQEAMRHERLKVMHCMPATFYPGNTVAIFAPTMFHPIPIARNTLCCTSSVCKTSKLVDHATLPSRDHFWRSGNSSARSSIAFTAITCKFATTSMHSNHFLFLRINCFTAFSVKKGRFCQPIRNKASLIAWTRVQAWRVCRCAPS